MPLTTPESDFLAVYVDEYMAIESGPASRKLRARRLMGTDILHLLNAYIQANPPKLELREVEGRLVEVLVWGRSQPSPPDPPWPDRETAQQRNTELLTEREAKL
jgi:hypothetical protein